MNVIFEAHISKWRIWWCCEGFLWLAPNSVWFMEPLSPASTCALLLETRPLFVSSHGLLLVMTSHLPMVLPQSPINLRALPENLQLLKVNGTFPPLPGKDLPSPAIHPSSCFWLFVALSKPPIEPNIRCLLERILKKHHGFNCKYIKLLEVNITFLSIIHGLKNFFANY